MSPERHSTKATFTHTNLCRRFVSQWSLRDRRVWHTTQRRLRLFMLLAMPLRHKSATQIDVCKPSFTCSISNLMISFCAKDEWHLYGHGHVVDFLSFVTNYISINISQEYCIEKEWISLGISVIYQTVRCRRYAPSWSDWLHRISCTITYSVWLIRAKVLVFEN